MNIQIVKLDTSFQKTYFGKISKTCRNLFYNMGITTISTSFNAQMANINSASKPSGQTHLYAYY